LLPTCQATDPNKWGTAKSREDAIAMQTCEAHLRHALKKERARTLLGAHIQLVEPRMLAGSHTQ